jgi:hypothetical protein
LHHVPFSTVPERNDTSAEASTSQQLRAGSLTRSFRAALDLVAGVNTQSPDCLRDLRQYQRLASGILERSDFRVLGECHVNILAEMSRREHRPMYRIARDLFEAVGDCKAQTLQAVDRKVLTGLGSVSKYWKSPLLKLT